jgi:hypothetical protein
MTDQKRYNEQEIAEILERATAQEAVPLSTPPSEDGLTLPQLQEIGSEVGISPERISESARALASREGTGAQKSFLGAPRSVSRIIPLERDLTEDEWTRLVVDLRQTFDAVGTVRVHGPLRSWINGNLQVHVEPHGDGYRLRMKTTKGNTGPLAGVGAFLVSAGVLLMAMSSGAAPDTWGFVMGAAFGTAGLGQLGYLRAMLPGWARERATQMEGLAERLQLPEKD